MTGRVSVTTGADADTAFVEDDGLRFADDGAAWLRLHPASNATNKIEDERCIQISFTITL